MTDSARFHVDSRLATLLGEGYRSSEQALKELVDNAWDADAENVHVTLPEIFTNAPILIIDDGTGMTKNEILSEYLVVANDRRTRKGERTPRKRRQVKGRKGIGKFAGLMVAETMSVSTNARGKNCQIEINKNSLISAGKDLEQIDLPFTETECKQNEHGTIITLSHFNQNLSAPNPERLKQLLIIEYGRQNDFQIFVNNEQLAIADIPGEQFSHEEVIDGVPFKIRYTIAEGRKPLKQSGIAIRVNGKIIGSPTYLGLENDEYIPNKLLKRIYGEIEADGLADDVTADWGAIIENSKAYTAITNSAHSHVKQKLELKCSQEINLAKARIQKEINSRLEKIPEHRHEFARRALAKVMQKFYGETEERIATIVSVTLEAFEKDEYWLVIQEIDNAKGTDVEKFADALEDFGLLDMAMIAQQASNRLRFLDYLDDLAGNKDTLEKTMHTALEKNLWVLGNQFSLMSSNKTTSRIIKNYTEKEFQGDRANKRSDLLLSIDLDNKYLLIEFKRPSHQLSRDDENQAEKYRDDLTPHFGPMDIIVIGDKRNFPTNYDKAGIEILSYAAIISSARRQLAWLIEQLKSEVTKG